MWFLPLFLLILLQQRWKKKKVFKTITNVKSHHPKLMLERKVVDQGNVWAVNYNKLIHYERSKLEESTNKFFSEKIIQKELTVTYYLEKQ